MTARRIAGTRDYYGSELRRLRDLRALLNEQYATYGYRQVEPPVVGRAEPYLKRSGDTIRRRMYVFEDPGGQELCLRPEMTIPTCRLYVEALSDSGAVPESTPPTRLAYEGAVFRYAAPKAGRYRQFLQSGVELIGDQDPELADAEILSLAVSALGAVGIDKPRLVLGDIAVARAFIDELPLTERWRALIRRRLDQPAALAELESSEGREEAEAAFLAALADLGPERSQAVVARVLDLAGVRQVGGRTLEEIANRFLSRAETAPTSALSGELLERLQALLAMRGAPDQVVAKARAMGEAGGPLSQALDRFERRLKLAAAQGLDLDRVEVDLGLRRNLAYYTGMVFDVFASAEATGEGNTALCGGGRYGRLLSLLGAGRDIPAVGFAIGLDRLVDAGQSGDGADPIDVQLALGQDPEAAARLAAELRGEGLRVVLGESRTATCQVTLNGESAVVTAAGQESSVSAAELLGWLRENIPGQGDGS